MNKVEGLGNTNELEFNNAKWNISYVIKFSKIDIFLKRVYFLLHIYKFSYV